MLRRATACQDRVEGFETETIILGVIVLENYRIEESVDVPVGVFGTDGAGSGCIF